MFAAQQRAVVALVVATGEDQGVGKLASEMAAARIDGQLDRGDVARLVADQEQDRVRLVDRLCVTSTGYRFCIIGQAAAAPPPEP